jgi:hypothetical protein
MYKTVNDSAVLILWFVGRILTDGKKVSTNLIYSSHLCGCNITGVYYGGGGGGDSNTSTMAGVTNQICIKNI